MLSVTFQFFVGLDIFEATSNENTIKITKPYRQTVVLNYVLSVGLAKSLKAVAHIFALVSVLSARLIR